MYMTRKYYTDSKQLFGMKLRFKLYFSIPQTWKLQVKLPIGLVAVCSIHKATLATNTRAKADAATKVL